MSAINTITVEQPELINAIDTIWVAICAAITLS